MPLGTVEALKSAVASNLAWPSCRRWQSQRTAPISSVLPLRLALSRTLALIEHRHKPNEPALHIVRNALLVLRESGSNRSRGASAAGLGTSSLRKKKHTHKLRPRGRPARRPASGWCGCGRSSGDVEALIGAFDHVLHVAVDSRIDRDADRNRGCDTCIAMRDRGLLDRTSDPLGEHQRGIWSISRSSTTNSSPPKRAALSVVRIDWPMISAIRLIASSPAAWPWACRSS